MTYMPEMRTLIVPNVIPPAVDAKPVAPTMSYAEMCRMERIAAAKRDGTRKLHGVGVPIEDRITSAEATDIRVKSVLTGPIAVSEISRQIEVPLSTVRASLGRLVAAGVAVRGETKPYKYLLASADRSPLWSKSEQQAAERKAKGKLVLSAILKGFASRLAIMTETGLSRYQLDATVKHLRKDGRVETIKVGVGVAKLIKITDAGRAFMKVA